VKPSPWMRKKSIAKLNFDVYNYNCINNQIAKNYRNLGEKIMNGTYSKSQYLVKRKFFKIFGASFKIYDNEENLCFFVKQKAFKLKEDIRVFSDETKTTELLLIQARNVIDFSAAYDVFDSLSGEKLGAFRRKGFKSIFKDEWQILNAQDNEIGKIHEDSVALALLRRFLTNLIPQKFHGFIGQNEVFTFKQKFNPILFKMVLDFSADEMFSFDRRMGISAAVLLSAIEGRQNR